jgi:hypothetical protein
MGWFAERESLVAPVRDRPIRTRPGRQSPAASRSPDQAMSERPVARFRNWRCDMRAVVDGSAAGRPAGPLPQCPHAPAAVAGVRGAVRIRVPVSASRVRCPRVRRQQRPIPVDQHRRADGAKGAHGCLGTDAAVTGPPHVLPRPVTAARRGNGGTRVSGCLRNRTLLQSRCLLRRRFAPVGWLEPMPASVGLAIASGPTPRKGLGTPVGAVGPYRM